VEVEVRAEKFTALAKELEEPQRTEVYEKIAAAAPIFAEYQSKTTRKIPVIILQRSE
jgi:hypothetical protein